MNAFATTEIETTTGLCVSCGIPQDSQYFDDSNVLKAPALGEEVALARFELPAQYCGVLQYFSPKPEITPETIDLGGSAYELIKSSATEFEYTTLAEVSND